MTPFLRAALTRAETERVQRMVAMRGHELPGGGMGLPGVGGDFRSPSARTLMAERARRVMALRAEGLEWVVIAQQLGLSPRQARHAAKLVGHG